MELQLNHSDALGHRLDRIGIFASVGCAIHCLVAPLLVLVAPLLGGFWVHPATHVGIAALVVPVALFSLGRGYRRHQHRWVVGVGVLGVALVVLGALWPLMIGSFAAGAAAHGGPCQECCPSILVNDATGEWSFRFPPASVITMVGGANLVIAHWGNLRLLHGCCPGLVTKGSVGQSRVDVIQGTGDAASESPAV